MRGHPLLHIRTVSPSPPAGSDVLAPVSRRRPTDVARYLIGVNVCSAGVALAIDSNLGAAPYDALLTGLASALTVPYWVAAWAMTAVWIVVVKALGGKITGRQIVHGALFGPTIELYLAVVGAPSSLDMQIAYGAAGILGIAAGIHLFLSAQVLSGVVDTLFETVGDRFRIGVNGVRSAFDIITVGAALTLGGRIGPLTIAVAVSVAPLLALLHRFGRQHPMVRSWRGIRLTD